MRLRLGHVGRALRREDLAGVFDTELDQRLHVQQTRTLRITHAIEQWAVSRWSFVHRHSVTALTLADAVCHRDRAGWCPSVGVVLTRADAVQAIDVATERLLRTVDRFSDHDIERPSALPGWTRGHVLAHVAQTADAMRNRLVWARTGVPLAAYAGQAARDAAIEAGAGRSASALMSELSESAARFRNELTSMPAQAWQRRVRVLAGAEFPAAQLLDRWLVEIELHHTDLDAGYGPEQWPSAFAHVPLPEPMRTQREDRRRAGTQEPPAASVRILLVSGSTRAGSTNTAVLRTAPAVAPEGVASVLYDGLASLPAFNPDDDHKPLPPTVANLRAQLAASDAVLFCTPEYAGALPGSFKNLLDWTVGGGEIYGKPVAWINVSSVAAPTGGADAHASQAKVLGYVGADLTDAACARAPMTRSAVGPDGP